MKKAGVMVAALVFAASAFADDVLSIDKIIRYMDPAAKTKAQLTKYYSDLRGKKASGEGRVVNVMPGRKKFKTPEKGYNVVLYFKGDAPTGLEKGSRVSFKGEVGRYGTFRGLSIDVHGTYKRLS